MVRWLEEPLSLAPDMVETVLDLANRSGGADMQQRLLTALSREQAPAIRRQLLQALSAVDEPALVRQQLGMPSPAGLRTSPCPPGQSCAGSRSGRR